MEENDAVNFEHRKPLMLLGLRNGDIIEVDLECEYENEPQDEYSDDDHEGPSQDIELVKVQFHCRLLLRNHSMQSSGEKFDLIDHNRQKKLHIAVHPKETLMATIGSDKNLCFWDTYEHRIVEKKELQTQPTCLKWSNDSEGTFLVVGFITGVLDIYQLTEVKTVYDKSANSSRLPSGRNQEATDLEGQPHQGREHQDRSAQHRVLQQQRFHGGQLRQPED